MKTIWQMLRIVFWMLPAQRAMLIVSVTLATGFGNRTSTGMDSFAIALRMPFRGVFRCGKNITLPAARLLAGGPDRANTTPRSA